MNWFPPHECGLHLSHNEHKNSYETVSDWAERGFVSGDEWVSPEEKQKAIDTNELWTLQWYPDTPIGFHRIAASSLEAIQVLFTKPKGG